MTILFADGFENGNFDNWTNHSAAITTSLVHHGNYALFSDAIYEYADKNIGSQSTVFIRAYIYVNDAFGTGISEMIMRLSVSLLCSR